MFPPPFQYFSAKDLGGVLRYFIVSWCILGIPTLCLFLLAGHFRIIRGLRFRTVALVLPVLGLFFGLTAGMFNVWTDHQYYADGMTERRYEIFALPGEPGDAMANSYGGDWQADEAWDYRSDIMIWSGLFRASVAAVGVFVIRFPSRETVAVAPLHTS